MKNRFATLTALAPRGPRRSSGLMAAMAVVGSMAAAGAAAGADNGAVRVGVSGKGAELISIEINTDLGSIPKSEERIVGAKALRLELREGLTYDRPGQPDVPVLHRLVAVDPDAVYDVEVKLAGRQVLNDVLLAPARADAIDDGRPVPAVIDVRAYESDTELGAPTVVAGDRVRIGPVTLLPLRITPIHYNPARRTLTVWSRVTATLKPAGLKRPARFAEAGAALTPFQASSLLALAENGAAAVRSLKVVEAPRVLVVTSSQLLEQAKKLADPARVMGVSWEFMTLDGGMTSTALRDRIQEQYDRGGLESVVLFGDETVVPLHNWSQYTPGDWFYSLLSGADNYADVGLGRLPATDAAEAGLLLERLNQYARLYKEGQINRNVLLVAHREQYPDKYTANMERIRTAPNPRGFSYTTRYGGARATNTDVLQSVNEGAGIGIVGYRGHGVDNAWIAWDFANASYGYPEIDRMTNTEGRMSVIFNIACDTGALHMSYHSMAEKLMLQTNASGAAVGAVAVLASTVPSYTEVNHRFNEYLFAALGSEASLSLGHIVGVANNRLVRDAGGPMPENVKMYILFGDPLLAPWIQ